MESSELGRVLREATRDVAPRPGFTEAVVRGGIRRRTRRRVVLGGATLTLVAVVVAGTVAIWAAEDTVGTANRRAVPNPMLTAPTRGDLAWDNAFQGAALEAFRAGIANSPNRDRGVPTKLIGESRVYWAGTTPAGRAAVVVQGGPMILDTVGDPEGVRPPAEVNVQPVLIGLVAGDVPMLIDEVPFVRGGPAAGQAFMFGPDDRVILAISGDTPLYVSTLTVATNGTTHRDWQSLATVDGMAMTELSAGTAVGDVRVVRTIDPTRATGSEALLMLPASLYRVGFDRQSKPITDHRLPWPGGTVLRVTGAPADLPSNVEYFDAALAGVGMLDPFRRASLAGFRIVAGLPGGRAVVAVEYQPDSGPSRLYALMFTADRHIERVLYAGALDSAAILPARLRLPDGQGWLVADRGATLGYRTGGTAILQQAGLDAALLPDNTTQVEVTRPGSAPVPVDLNP
jgi:hypothetical protein